MVVGCAGVDSSTASTVALGGVITVEGAVNGSEEKCRGPHPLFSDIERGMKIVVRDDRGDVLGTGELDAGVPYLDHRSGTQDVYFCRLPFVVGLARYVDVYDFSFGKRGGPS